MGYPFPVVPAQADPSLMDLAFAGMTESQS